MFKDNVEVDRLLLEEEMRHEVILNSLRFVDWILSRAPSPVAIEQFIAALTAQDVLGAFQEGLALVSLQTLDRLETFPALVREEPGLPFFNALASGVKGFLQPYLDWERADYLNRLSWCRVAVRGSATAHQACGPA